MKIIGKIIMAILAAAIILLISLSILVSLYGKKILETQIENNLKMQASLEKISFSLPLSVNITNLKMGDLFKADSISLKPSILGFLAGKIVLNQLVIINPVVNLEQSQTGALNLPKLEPKGKQPPIFLTGLVIKDGKLNFTDKKIDPQGFTVILDMINVDIAKVAFPPTSLNTKFNISANLADPQGKALGSTSANGWVDFGKKDMDAVFKLQDLQAAYFNPYMGDFISHKKILSAKLNLTTDLKAVNDDLEAKCNFALSNIVYAQEEQKEEELPQLNLAKNALDLFTDKDGKLNLDFTINTKLDNPQLSAKDLKKTVMEAALKNLSNQPPEELMQKVNDTIKQFKEFGKSFKGLLKKDQQP